MDRLIAIIGMSAYEIRTVAAAANLAGVTSVLVVSDRTAPAIELDLAVKEMTLRNFALPEFEKLALSPFKERASKRLPHWQRHNRTPFYATAPRGRRRK